MGNPSTELLCSKIITISSGLEGYSSSSSLFEEKVTYRERLDEEELGKPLPIIPNSKSWKAEKVTASGSFATESFVMHMNTIISKS